MSASDSRKSFIAKITLCGVAVLAAPGLVWRRIGGAKAPASGSGAAASVVLKPDHRAVARESV